MTEAFHLVACMTVIGAHQRRSDLSVADIRRAVKEAALGMGRA